MRTDHCQILQDVRSKGSAIFDVSTSEGHSPPVLRVPTRIFYRRCTAYTMSGWTTIWVLLIVVGVSSGAWVSTPKGPNQV